MFRAAAVEGGDTVRLRIPAKYRPIILRKKPARRHEPKLGKRPQPTFRKNISAQPVTAQTEAGVVDTLIETQERLGLPVQDELEAIAKKNECEFEARRRLTFAADGSCPEQPTKRFDDDRSSSQPFKRVKVEETESNNAILLAGCAAIALLYFAT